MLERGRVDGDGASSPLSPAPSSLSPRETRRGTSAGARSCLSPVPRGRPRSRGRGGPPRVPPETALARRLGIGPHPRFASGSAPSAPSAPACRGSDPTYERDIAAHVRLRHRFRSARLRRSRGGRREPEKSDAKESRGGGRREMKKTKRLFLSSCLPRQAVGGRGGGRARSEEETGRRGRGRTTRRDDACVRDAKGTDRRGRRRDARDQNRHPPAREGVSISGGGEVLGRTV